jgi:truncated hemoglobin YjbI
VWFGERGSRCDEQSLSFRSQLATSVITSGMRPRKIDVSEAWTQPHIEKPLFPRSTTACSPSAELTPLPSAFDVESFGGPDRYTRELGGFQSIIDVHRHLRITEAQRQRFVKLYMAAADTAGLPDDGPFRDALRSHVEFGSRVAMRNSHARTDNDLHLLREVPRRGWDGE